MSTIYFVDDGVADPSTGNAVYTVYRIDPDQLDPTGSMLLETTGPEYPAPAVSYDGQIYARPIDFYSDPSKVVILNIEEGTQKALAYNPAGDRTHRCSFSNDGKLFLACTGTLSILQPPYDTVQEVALPVEIDSLLLFPSGKRAVLFESQTVGYIYDIESSSLSEPFDLLQDEATAIELFTAQISPDSSRFAVGCFYGDFEALAIFDSGTGAYVGRTGSIVSQSTGYFLPDGSAIAYKRSDRESLGIFDLATSAESVISLTALTDSGYNYSLSGVTDDNYAVMLVDGDIRLISLSDGSLAATPMTRINSGGTATVQPLAGVPGTILKYFWTYFLKAYEQPAIVSG